MSSKNKEPNTMVRRDMLKIIAAANGIDPVMLGYQFDMTVTGNETSIRTDTSSQVISR